MNWLAISFDWNQVRAFLATAEEGTLSAAARALGQSQPTLGRQVAALEEALGVVLFERVGRSLELTPTGRQLLEHVRVMADAAGRISLAASGQSQAVEGNVSVSASDIMAAWVLPEMIARLRVQAPGIEITLLAENAVADLQRREADIAIRHLRPEAPELYARLLGEATAHLCAASTLFERHARPETPGDLARLPFVGMSDKQRFAAELRRRGFPISEDQFPVSSPDGNVAWQLVRAGLGVSVMPLDLVERTPEVELLLPDQAAIRFPVWLTVHREIRTSRRIRVVFDALAEEFGAVL